MVVAVVVLVVEVVAVVVIVVVVVVVVVLVHTGTWYVVVRVLSKRIVIAGCTGGALYLVCSASHIISYWPYKHWSRWVLRVRRHRCEGCSKLVRK